MATQKKLDTVAEVSKNLQEAKTVVITDYMGLTHKQLEEMRKSLKKAGASFHIIKNTLLKRALSDAKKPALDDYLNGPTAVLVGQTDDTTPLQLLMKTIKSTGLPKVKGGFFLDTILSSEDVIKLSNLPSKPILVGRFAGSLKGPLYGLHYALNWNMRSLVFALNAVKGKKTS